MRSAAWVGSLGSGSLEASPTAQARLTPRTPAGLFFLSVLEPTRKSALDVVRPLGRRLAVPAHTLWPRAGDWLRHPYSRRRLVATTLNLDRAASDGYVPDIVF